MQLLTVAVALLLAHTVHGQVECDILDTISGVKSSLPFKLTYDEDDEAAIVCTDGYIVSWAVASDTTTSTVTCKDDGTGTGIGKWFRKDDADYSGDIYCSACTAGVPCEGGDCNSSGVCVCASGSAVGDDKRVCEAIKCDAPTLASATATPQQDSYAMDSTVTVECVDGYHIQGAELSVTTRTLTCQQSGSFDPVVPNCVVCEEGQGHCTDGSCISGICHCTPPYKLSEDSSTVCTEVVCGADSCQNGATCSVQGTAINCVCPAGTTGATCAEFTTELSELCENPNPCKNGGTCSRDEDNLTTYACTCTGQFIGAHCEYAKAFHISTSDAGVAFKFDEDKNAVELNVNVAKTLPDMYIALLQVADTDSALYKMVLKNVGDSSSIAVSITKDESSSQYATASSLIENLDNDFRSALNIKIFIDSSFQLAVEINSNAAAGYLSKTNDYPLVSFRTIKEVRFGGNLGDCKWDDITCTIGASRVKYVPFVGTFYGVTISNDNGDDKLDFATIMSKSLEKAVATAMDCATFTCENNGKCADANAIIACTACPNGFAGFNCDKYSGISFNGYKSSFTTSNAVSVPLAKTEQSLFIEFEKSATEVGELARLTLGVSCTLSIKAAGGTNYIVGVEEVEVVGTSLAVVLDGTNANIGDVSSSCTWDFTTSISSVVEVTLGGSGTTASSRYQGCIKKVALNGVNLLVINSATLVEVDTENCVTDNLPSNPCTPNPCQNDEMECTVNLVDYSASCACVIPYVEGALCARKEYCVSGHLCATNGACTEFLTVDACTTVQGADKCGEEMRWYYYCECAAGWQGDNCDEEIKQPTEKPVTEKPVTEPVKTDSNNNTMIIIIVVVVGAVLLGIIAVVYIVKKRRGVAANGTSNGKSKGTYSPQAQEKDLELAVTKEEEPHKNIYDDAEVIKNPNAESPVVEAESAPPYHEQEPTPADATVTIEPESDTGSHGPEGPPPDSI